MSDHTNDGVARQRAAVTDWDNDPEYYGGDDPEPNWPVGEMIDCYTCKPIVGEPRKCTALGPVVNPADPTQSYQLECGHLAI
jgi:hypothetical protein